MLNRTAYKNITSTGAVAAGETWISGYTCNSTSSGTFALYDGLSATGSIIIGTITPTAGATVALPNVHFKTGCWAVIANTLNITFYTQEN